MFPTIFKLRISLTSPTSRVKAVRVWGRTSTNVTKRNLNQTLVDYLIWKHFCLHQAQRFSSHMEANEINKSHDPTLLHYIIRLSWFPCFDREASTDRNIIFCIEIRAIFQTRVTNLMTLDLNWQYHRRLTTQLGLSLGLGLEPLEFWCWELACMLKHTNNASGNCDVHV